MLIPRYVRKVIERLEENGYEAYVVGGCLRDMMLGRVPNDFDVATSALPNDTLRVFSDMRTIPTGLKHGTVTVICEGEQIEITTFRIDGEYCDSRHPESVAFTEKIEKDLSRRDFTVNAMAYNEKRGIVDPFGGAFDLKYGVLRAVREPELRMREDALRIMRALRFSAQLGFEIEENTRLALGSMRDGLANVSGERIGIETEKLVCAKYPKEPIRLMCSLGISPYVLGDYVPGEGILSELEALPNDPVTRFGCLFWECESEEIPPILSALKYSNDRKRAILNVRDSKNFKSPENDADIRRFLLRYGREADYAALLRRMLCGDKMLLPDTLRRVRENGFCDGISNLALGGDDLIRLGIRGKKVGQILNELLCLVTEDPSLNTQEALKEYIEKRRNI